MTVSPPTLPPNVKTTLGRQKYVIKTYGQKGYNDSFTFYFRDSLQQPISFQVGDNDPFLVDGRIVEAVLFEPPKGSPDTAFIYTGSDTVALLLLQTLGKTYNQYITMQGSDTPFRLLEKIAETTGSLSGPYILDESLAAGDSGSSGSVGAGTGAKVVFSWGISQDTLGTSPHGSYIGLYNGDGKLIFRVRGAVNPYGSVHFTMDSSGSLTVAYENGDSVAHFFVAMLTVNTL